MFKINTDVYEGSADPHHLNAVPRLCADAGITRARAVWKSPEKLLVILG